MKISLSYLSRLPSALVDFPSSRGDACLQPGHSGSTRGQAVKGGACPLTRCRSWVGQPLAAQRYRLRRGSGGGVVKARARVRVSFR
ncbi:hypothetical protein BHE74_00046712 [Ensete ventricosum]|nr:hypothetical protein GW17_00052815 [Ensete ventricosum]RWW47314.1 hypothetical protein BHE74_00046712 [Ensete ventricosum]RZS11358.1 hypothetical protein BHM03_00042678 [Ensete ventricosum]